MGMVAKLTFFKYENLILRTGIENLQNSLWTIKEDLFKFQLFEMHCNL